MWLSSVYIDIGNSVALSAEHNSNIEHYAIVEGLPVHSFNGVISSSARVCTLQSFIVFPYFMVPPLYQVEGHVWTGIRISLITIAYIIFSGLVEDLVVFCAPLLFLVQL